MQELTIKDILRIIQKRLWLVVAFCVIVTFVAGIYFMSQPDEYTAETMLHVLPVYQDNNENVRFDAAAGAQLAVDYKELINTPTIMAQAQEKLGKTQDDLDAVTIDISTAAGSRILHIFATSSNPLLSKQVANAVSEAFIEHIQNVLNEKTAYLFANATLPDNPSGPNRMRNILLAGIVSLTLVVGLVLALEMLNTTLRTADAVESALNLPVLASIQSYRKEIIQFLQKRPPGEMLSNSIPVATKENINALVANIQFATIANPIQTMIVTSSSAGEGKSSMLLLLSEAFASLNKRVLLVDMDMRNPSLWKYIGSRGRNDLFDYLVGHCRLEEVICKTGNPGIHFIDSRHHLASVSQIVNFEIFDRFLDNVKRSYDFVIFDTPPLGLFIDAAALANKMDATLLVVGKGMTDTKVAADVVNQLHKASANILGVALNFEDCHKGQAEYYGKSYPLDKKEQAASSKKISKDT